MQTLRAITDVVYVTKAGQTDFAAGQTVELEEGHPLIGELLETGQFELVAQAEPSTVPARPGKP